MLPEGDHLIGLVLKYWYYNNKEEVIQLKIKINYKSHHRRDKETSLSLMDNNNPKYTGDSNFEGFYEFDISKVGDDGNKMEHFGII